MQGEGHTLGADGGATARAHRRQPPGFRAGATSGAAVRRESSHHCGIEQIVVSIRKLEATVWRSAWKTSRL